MAEPKRFSITTSFSLDYFCPAIRLFKVGHSALSPFSSFNGRPFTHHSIQFLISSRVCLQMYFTKIKWSFSRIHQGNKLKQSVFYSGATLENCVLCILFDGRNPVQKGTLMIFGGLSKSTCLQSIMIKRTNKSDLKWFYLFCFAGLHCKTWDMYKLHLSPKVFTFFTEKQGLFVLHNNLWSYLHLHTKH